MTVRTGDAVTVKARAKINLYLHVLGRREDGYHELDSLFVFQFRELPWCEILIQVVLWPGGHHRDMMAS